MTQTLMQEKTTVIGLGQWHISGDAEGVLVCLGLGSCVALCAYDPLSRIGGMAHLVLPDSSEGRDTSHSAKFVDVGIPLLLGEMEKLGAARSRMIIRIVGGAHMIVATATNGANIGDRNAQAARAVLAGLGLRLRGEDVGGNRGRTVRLYVGSGQLAVSTVGGPSYEL